MGLDWKPLGRAKAGQEAMLDDVVRALRSLDHASDSTGDIARERSLLVERYREMTDPPYATLGAPRVGVDDAANRWILEKCRDAGQDVDERVVLDKNRGIYVLELLPVCDGFPVYTNSPFNPDLERYCFRASFLDNVKLELGDELYDLAWTLMTAAELLAYGQRIEAIANRFSASNDVVAIANARQPPDGGDDTAARAHILASAARWCLYWAGRGHGLEPDS